MNFTSANLTGTNLTFSVMTLANLTFAKLIGTDFTGDDLHQVQRGPHRPLEGRSSPPRGSPART